MEALQAQLHAMGMEQDSLVAELAALRLATRPQARTHPTIRFGGGSNQMHMMLRQHRSSLTTETVRIDYISMHLVDGALAWFTALSELQDPRVNGTAKDFLTALEHQYGGIEPGHQANLEIDKLTQGIRCANDYICHFLQISACSTYCNDALVNALWRNFSPALAERVAYFPRTYDLHVLQRQILESEMALQEQARVRRQCSSFPVTAPLRTMQTRPGRYPQTGQDVRSSLTMETDEPMDLNATARGSLNEKERQRRYQQSLCFYCGGQGLQVQACSQRTGRRYYRGRRIPTDTTSHPRHLVVRATLIIDSRRIPVRALVDSGASDNFIDDELAHRLQLPLTKLDQPSGIENVDGQPNLAGPIQYQVQSATFQLQDHLEQMNLYLTRLKRHDIVLGLSWLWKHNPNIDFRRGTITFPDIPLSPIFCERNTNKVIGSVEMANFPVEYIQFCDIFCEQEATRLPEHNHHDCALKLKDPAAKLPAPRMYKLTEEERNELRCYLDENLRKQFIGPSTSPAGSPIFFVRKKDGSLRPVVDYREVNQMMNVMKPHYL